VARKKRKGKGKKGPLQGNSDLVKNNALQLFSTGSIYRGVLPEPTDSRRRAIGKLKENEATKKQGEGES